MTTPGPGIYADVSFEDYLAWDACSSSRLTDLRDRSPAYCRLQSQNSEAAKSPQMLGSAAHAAILELGAFESRYAVKEQCEAETKAGAKCSKIGAARVDGRWYCGTKGHFPPYNQPDLVVAISRSDREYVLGMREAVYQVSAAARMLDSCELKEVSLVWNDPKTGVLCKARPDALRIQGDDLLTLDRGPKLCVNLKTTALLPRAWTRTQDRYGLDRSIAHYLNGLKVLGHPKVEYRVLVVMSDLPHEVTIWTPHEDLIELGRRTLEPLLKRYAECLESGKWPAVLKTPEFLVYDEWRMREGMPELAITLGGKAVKV